MDDPLGPVYLNGQPITNVDYPKYYEEYLYTKEKYKDQITLKLGLEFGIQVHTIPQYEALFKAYPFDFIILSIHQVDDLEFWTGDYQKGRTEEEYYTRYYQELYDVVKNYKNYSVLGHMDLMKRYDDMMAMIALISIRISLQRFFKSSSKMARELKSIHHQYAIN